MIFRESSARDPRKPARKRRLVLSERRASQYSSLVLETCDFKLELHGLRKAATFQLVHVMYYPCDSMKSCDFTAGVGESHFAHYAGTSKLRLSDLSNENGTAINPRKVRESNFFIREEWPFRDKGIENNHHIPKWTNWSPSFASLSRMLDELSRC